MELTLIPIAAILLLLTGFNAPSRLASGLQPAGSSLRLWLNRERCERASNGAERGRLDPASRTPGVGQQSGQRRAQVTLAGETRLAFRRLSRTLLQMRCGVASCVYRSAAPPPFAVGSRLTAA